MNRVWRRIIITALIVDKKIITGVAHLFWLEIEIVLIKIFVYILRAIAWFMARVLLGMSQKKLDQMYEEARERRARRNCEAV